MSILRPQDIQNIAGLARVSVTDAEGVSAAKDLSGILEHFETIRAIDTTTTLPADDVSGLKNVVREDVARENVLASPEELLKKAKTNNGYVAVPGVFS